MRSIGLPARHPAAPTLWIAFLALSAIWGSSYFFIKIAVATLPPLTLVTDRLVIGVAFLGGWLLLTRGRLVTDRPTLLRLAFLCVFNVAVPFGLIAWAEQSITSALANIINATVPLFSLVIAALALHDEPITLNRLAGLAIGFAGVTLIFTRDLAGAGLGQGGSMPAGEAAMLLSSVTYAVSVVFARRALRGLTPVQIALPQLAGAALLTGTAALFLDRPASGLPVVLPAAPEALLAVAWLGVLGSGVAYLLFFRLISGWGATRTTLVAYVMPLVGVTLGVVGLGETLDLPVIAGTALILGGVVLVNLRVGTRRLYGRGAAGAPAALAEPARSEAASGE